jgi:non-heme chloroperoxidase
MSTFRTSDGVRLHHTDDGDGRPVVLIAGFTAPAESWEFQRRALLAEGHRVLALDRRSHDAGTPPMRALLPDHAVNIDQPERTNAAILEFIA